MAQVRAPGSAPPSVLPAPMHVEGRRESSRIFTLLMWLGNGLAAYAAAVIVVGLIWAGPMITLVLLALGLVLGLWAAFDLLHAKQEALRIGFADAWLKLLRVVAWDPTQGVLFLKEKMLDYVDSNPNDGGGVRVLIPFLGEEEACRVPLEVQTLPYWDENVLTREYVPLELRGNVYWRIVDVSRFYLLVSREVHAAKRRGRTAAESDAQVIESSRVRSGTNQQIEAAKEWLRSIAEEQTRSVIANVRTGLLVAEGIASALPPGLREQFAPTPPANDGAGGTLAPSSSKTYRSIAEQLGESIRLAMESVAPEYGIHVDRVTLQEVIVPPSICESAAAACTTAYKPLEAYREAIAARMHNHAAAEGRGMGLAAEAEVIGAEAVANREVMGSIQPFALGAPQGVRALTKLDEYFERTKAQRQRP